MDIQATEESLEIRVTLHTWAPHNMDMDMDMDMAHAPRSEGGRTLIGAERADERP